MQDDSKSIKNKFGNYLASGLGIIGLSLAVSCSDSDKNNSPQPPLDTQRINTSQTVQPIEADLEKIVDSILNPTNSFLSSSQRENLYKEYEKRVATYFAQNEQQHITDSTQPYQITITGKKGILNIPLNAHKYGFNVDKHIPLIEQKLNQQANQVREVFGQDAIPSKIEIDLVTGRYYRNERGGRLTVMMDPGSPVFHCDPTSFLWAVNENMFGTEFFQLGFKGDQLLMDSFSRYLIALNSPEMLKGKVHSQQDQEYFSSLLDQDKLLEPYRMLSSVYANGSIESAILNKPGIKNMMKKSLTTYQQNPTPWINAALSTGIIDLPLYAGIGKQLLQEGRIPTISEDQKSALDKIVTETQIKRDSMFTQRAMRFFNSGVVPRAAQHVAMANKNYADSVSQQLRYMMNAEKSTFPIDGTSIVAGLCAEERMYSKALEMSKGNSLKANQVFFSYFATYKPK